MPKIGFKHSKESKNKISVGAIRTMKQSNAGFKQVVSCPYCSQKMSPANLGKHKDVCQTTRGMFIGDKELSVKDIKRLRVVLKKYGWNVSDYITIHDKQNGMCAICGNHPYKSRLSADHSHLNNSPRGLLCERCNAGLGNFLDSISNLKNAITYLRKYIS